mmetsp:Transcript_37617/g.38065  ORF Transcript_37617/g.38065 Transcript_37617/m.38065 type:complete len:105 (-) Transcript_37617:108-422(-)
MAVHTTTGSKKEEKEKTRTRRMVVVARIVRFFHWILLLCFFIGSINFIRWIHCNATTTQQIIYYFLRQIVEHLWRRTAATPNTITITTPSSGELMRLYQPTTSL